MSTMQLVFGAINEYVRVYMYTPPHTQTSLQNDLALNSIHSLQTPRL